MIILRQVFCYTWQVLQSHHCFLGITCLVALAVLAVLHYQLVYVERDLLYWIAQFNYWKRNYEPYTTTAILAIISVKLIVIRAIIRSSSNRLEHISQLEMKKRYGQYLIVRLFNDISEIEERYGHHMVEESQEVLADLLKAHEDLGAVIDDFRKNARKLFAPNEREVRLPIEEVYGLLEHEEKLLKQSRFSEITGLVNDELIRSLINP